MIRLISPGMNLPSTKSCGYFDLYLFRWTKYILPTTSAILSEPSVSVNSYFLTNLRALSILTLLDQSATAGVWFTSVAALPGVVSSEALDLASRILLSNTRYELIPCSALSALDSISLLLKFNYKVSILNSNLRCNYFTLNLLINL